MAGRESQLTLQKSERLGNLFRVVPSHAEAFFSKEDRK